MKEGLQKVIAIDGPSGSGKSTMAKRLAQELSLLYINTGSMFRALALGMHRDHINLESKEEVESWLKALDFQYGVSENSLVVVNGQDLTQDIYHHETSELSSRVSQIPQVRSFLLNFQRSLVTQAICVMEGRDIGTVVFPHAFCKIFFTASVEVRAQRRFEELRQKKLPSSSLTFESVLKDVEERDRRDLEREVAPLIEAKDAVHFDTSELSPNQVLESLVSIVKEKAKDAEIAL